jgi:TDG/mug DNA glycosylase family protein
MALADLYAETAVGAVADVVFRPSTPDRKAIDLLTGAGFRVTAIARGEATAERIRSLPDTVGPRMRLLVCGLNPSLYAADAGVGFARPGNRYWPAALSAGLVTADRDARRALTEHGVGMTDLCKRATAASAELTRREYRDGAARVERLVAWLRPDAVCFVGLEGWRASIDRTAKAGPQPHAFGGRPAYVMPSTSGLNAHARLGDLVAHLQAAWQLGNAPSRLKVD